MKNRNILLSVIGIATLLVAIVGATFAWFSVQTNGDVNAKTEINTANLGTVTFANGNVSEATGSDIYPGWSNNAITFSVIGANTTENIEYTITATVTGSSTLASALTYNMSCESSNGGTCATTVTSAPLSTTIYTGTLATGNDTHTYTVTMALPETNTNQNAYQGQNYKVEFSVVLSKPTTKYTQGSSSKVAWTTPETCFTTSDVDGGVQITAYDTSCGGSVMIPNTIGGKSVVDISSSAFGGKSDITEVSIPGSVKNVGSVFCGCGNLKTLILNEGTESVGNYAFNCGVSNLSSVNFPSTLTTLGQNSFANTALKSVDLSNVTNLGNGAFQYCNNLVKATLNTSLTAIPDYLFAYGSNSIDVNLSSMTNLKTIGEYAFAYKNFKNIVVPDGVETIKYRAFLGNGGNFETGTITIPESVMTIGDLAFFNAKVSKVCIKGKSSAADFTSYPTTDPFTAMTYGTFSDITWNCTD